MDLSQLRQSYDLILSIGYNCDSALYLRKNELRSFSGPVDWVLTGSIPQLIRLLETRFENFMKLENLKVIGSVYGHLSLEDTATGTLSFHDFPVQQDFPDQIAQYPEFSARLQRRIDRFYEYAQASKKALYVRMQADAQEALDLQRALKRISGGEVYLLVANYADVLTEKEVEWGLPAIAAVEIPLQENLRETAWRNVFSGITRSS